jgi:hypothetical protein
MLQFYCHPDFEKEAAKLKGRFNHLDEAIEDFKRLSNVQFDPISPKQVIAPAKIHRVTQKDLWAVWKVELVIPKSGLRPNQFPRLWFAIKGANMAFLCVKSHIDNYKDDEINKIVIERVQDIF